MIFSDFWCYNHLDEDGRIDSLKWDSFWDEQNAFDFSTKVFFHFLYSKQTDVESQPLLQQQQQQQQRQQQQQMVPLQDSYMQSRAEALHNVESTIHELSNIFTQLATMVSQQGELAIRFVINYGIHP